MLKKFFRKIFENSKRMKEEKEHYSKQVTAYIAKSGEDFMSELLKYNYHKWGYTTQRMKKILKSCPKASWVDEENMAEQFICFIHQVSDVSITVEKGMVFIDSGKEYYGKVQEYYKQNEDDIMKKLISATAKKELVLYDDMLEIIGPDFPKAFKDYTKLNIIFFLKQTDIPFCFDSRQLYFL